MKNQNLNIGDKLLCKNYLKTEYSRLIEGDYYLLVDFEIFNHEEYCDVNYTFYDEYNYDDYVYYIDDNNHHSFSILDEKDLYKYFYKKNEIRNMKLEKLKNV